MVLNNGGKVTNTETGHEFMMCLDNFYYQVTCNREGAEARSIPREQLEDVQRFNFLIISETAYLQGRLYAYRLRSVMPCMW